MWRQRIFVVAMLAVAGWQGWRLLRQPPAPRRPQPHALAVTSQPLPLEAGNPARQQLGPLEFRGALRLQGPGLGGISGLAAGPGGHMLAVSDAGLWFSFRVQEAGNRLVGTRNWWVGGMAGLDGLVPGRKADVDAESLIWQPAAGTAQVSMEDQHRILHFATGTGKLPGQPPAPFAGLQAVRDERFTATMAWPANSGGEALALLPALHGRLAGQRVLLAESARLADGRCEALLLDGGRSRRFGMACLAGFSPTDAVALDATRLIVLHRRFTLRERASALTLVDLAGVRAGGGHAPAQVLARWGPPQLWDNFEALALQQQGAETWLYLASDDNFNRAQRTLLLALALPPAMMAPAAP